MTQLEIEMERMSFGSAAVGRFTPEGADRPMVVFVEGALPGERVRAQVVQQHKNYWQANVVEVLRPSAERVTPKCPVFGSCGGCQWQHLNYPAQVEAKRGILAHQIQKSYGKEVAIEVHPAKNPWNYRARIQARGDAKGLGFFARGSHELVHVETCAVADPKIQKKWSKHLAEGIPGKLAKSTGSYKIEWTVQDGAVSEALNRGHAALGFLQINREQNEVLVRLVKDLARKSPGKGLLLDLFGGEGNLCSGLESEFQQVACIDSHNSGAAPADLGWKDWSGFRLVRQDSGAFLRARPWKESSSSVTQSIDCVISDPPRTGMKDSIRDLLAASPERIVMVSCDPATLGRDLAVLREKYTIEQVHLVDMFPQTYHIEAVIGLQRIGN